VKVRTTPVGFFVAYGDGVVDDRDLDAVRAGAEAALAPLSLRESRLGFMLASHGESGASPGRPLLG
jgi:hypothetical protein